MNWKDVEKEFEEDFYNRLNHQRKSLIDDNYRWEEEKDLFRFVKLYVKKLLREAMESIVPEEIDEDGNFFINEAQALSDIKNNIDNFFKEDSEDSKQ